jgi:hypothetical protein
MKKRSTPIADFSQILKEAGPVPVPPGAVARPLAPPPRAPIAAPRAPLRAPVPMPEAPTGIRPPPSPHPLPSFNVEPAKAPAASVATEPTAPKPGLRQRITDFFKSKLNREPTPEEVTAAEDKVKAKTEADSMRAAERAKAQAETAAKTQEQTAKLDKAAEDIADKIDPRSRGDIWKQIEKLIPEEMLKAEKDGGLSYEELTRLKIKVKEAVYANRAKARSNAFKQKVSTLGSRFVNALQGGSTQVNAAMAIGSVVTIAYYMFCGRAPAAKSEDAAKVTGLISQVNVEAPRMDTLLTSIDVAEKTIASSGATIPEVGQATAALTSLKQSATSVKNSSVNLDDLNTVQNFVNQLTALATQCDTFIRVAATLSQSGKSPEIDRALDATSDTAAEIMVEIKATKEELGKAKTKASAGGAGAKLASKIESICKATDIYCGKIAYAELFSTIMFAIGIYGVAAMTSAFINSLTHMQTDINGLKSKLEEMIGLVEKQRADGFGQFESIFNDWEKSAKTTVRLIDGVLQTPKDKMDKSQIENATKFLEAAQQTLYSSGAVLGALKQMQGLFSGVGELIHGISLNFGFDLTRWEAFNAATGQVSGSLSLVIKQVETALKNASEVGKKAHMEAAEKGPTQEQLAYKQPKPITGTFADLALLNVG